MMPARLKRGSDATPVKNSLPGNFMHLYKEGIDFFRAHGSPKSYMKS
jgi:hypothetical protein